MKAFLSVRLARALRLVLPAILLTGCFGEGDGPERILGTPAPPPPPLPPGFCDPINFEDVCPAPGIANFAGGATTIINNPDQSGINTSDQVAQMQKFADQPFGGTTITPVTPVTFGAGEAFTMNVWSPRAVPVLFKFEGLDKERSLSHSGSGAWEELCFDFSADTAGPAVTGITVIFDLGVNGEAATDPNNWTFYYDDLTQVASCPGGGPTTWSEITFDDPAITYSLTGFGGAEDSTIVADPTGGTNQVVQVNRSDSAEVFAGTTVATGLNNSTPTIPLDAASPQMTVRVYSPVAGVPVRLKIENANDSAVSVETEAVTTVANAWEELTFDFSMEVGGTPAFDPAANYNKVTIFFNFGADGATAGAQTYFFDDIDIAGSGGGGGPVTFSTVTFDDPAVTYTLRGFGGAEDSTVAADPTGGTNNVVQVNRSAAADTFAGTVVSTGANESIGDIPLDAANTTMSVRVYSPAAGIPVRLKIENSGDPAISVETETSTTAANTWETLTFDFTNEVSGTAAFDPAATYDKVVIFFNFGTDGATAGAQTYFFDDIDVGPGGGGGGGSFAPIDFDDPAITYTLRGFGGAEDSTFVTDPTGGSNLVVQVNRSAAAETFAGTVVSTGPNESIPPIPLDAANTTMTVRVYSPAAGIPVRLKIENSNDPAVSVETEATTTAANTWEELTFDFANQASGTAAFDPAATYDKVVIFFNFGTDGATAGAQTFFFDDIDVGPGGGGGGPTFDPITFDDPAITYTLRGFGGAEDSTVVGDPTGGMNMVVQVNRSAAAETFAGTVVSTGPNESIPAIPLDAANTTMNVRVYSPAAGIPVRLKIENSNDPAVSVETEATTTVANAFEALTFDFANQVSGTAAFDPAATYDKVVIFFNFGTDGATAGAQTYFFDDIDVGPGSGGGGGGSPSANVDFESGSATFNDFEGGVAAVVSNPDPSGLNTSSLVAQMQKFAGQPFGGSTLDLGGSVALAAGDSYQMLVRAERAVPVTFKLEPIGDERVANHSGSGDWELLCFDFTGVAGDVTGYTIIFDNGVVGDAANNPTDWTFQFDAIEQVSSCPTPPAPSFDPITFDDPAITYALRGFGGAEDSTVVQDPTDPANNVVQVNRSAAAETFAGTVVSTGPNESIPAIPLDAANTTMNVRVWSPAAGVPVRLKIENSANGAISVETEATTTVAMDWETLEFNFANQVSGTAAFDPAATYDKVVIFFNFGTDGATAGAQTFYFDDIDDGPAPTPPAPSYDAITFDDPAITYTLRGFGGAEDSTVVTDPTDPANNVAQVNRSAAAETFAGTVFSTGPNESIPVLPLDAANTTMNVRVWSPVAGIPVRLKIENSANGAISVETEATTSVAMDWDTLTFNFANEVSGTAAFDPAATYDKAVIFFNFGTTGAAAGAQTFYFDDVDVGPGPGGGGGGGGGGSTVLVNGDFEDNGGSLDGWTLTVAPPGSGQDPVADSSGQGMRAGTVARLVVAGSAASANDALISQEGLGAGTVMAGDTITVTFDMYGTVTQPGAAVFAEVIFLNAAGQDVGGRNFLNGDPTPLSPTPTWTPVSGTVTAGTGFVPNPAGGPWDVSGGLVLSLKVSCGPVDGCAQDVSFDNVTFTIN